MLCTFNKRYSPFLMACYDPDTDEYQSVCRVMSGFRKVKMASGGQDLIWPLSLSPLSKP
ncbi:putative DNA ligase (ATP) [Helianthus annuus]|nr:putative DNA ligase (ATP) [Helianthus annuus]KAJ0956291.1 putative DNA ligase (ATP) [Helianthus annuus]